MVFSVAVDSVIIRDYRAKAKYSSGGAAALDGLRDDDYYRGDPLGGGGRGPRHRARRKTFRPTTARCCKIGYKVAKRKLSCDVRVLEVVRKYNDLQRAKMRYNRPRKIKASKISAKLSNKLGKCSASFPRFFEKCCLYREKYYKSLAKCKKRSPRRERRRCRQATRRRYKTPSSSSSSSTSTATSATSTASTSSTSTTTSARASATNSSSSSSSAGRGSQRRMRYQPPSGIGGRTASSSGAGWSSQLRRRYKTPSGSTSGIGGASWNSQLRRYKVAADSSDSISRNYEQRRRYKTASDSSDSISRNYEQRRRSSRGGGGGGGGGGRGGGGGGGGRGGGGGGRGGGRRGARVRA